ncbi:paraspeckle component 1 isoform X1 [Anolis carolinensis]|uniref:paraspeckle component 1 isoform X1 n=1 Tax=Anolis carolinensis TaxID=28377 RepID=UPI002F2B6742
MVDSSQQHLRGRSIPPKRPIHHHHNRCLPHWMGSILRKPCNPRPLDLYRNNTPHQCPRTLGSLQGLAGVSGHTIQYYSSSLHRQHNGDVVHQQTRRYPVQDPPGHHTSNLGLVHRSQHLSHSHTSTGPTEHLGRPSQQGHTSYARVVPSSDPSSTAIQQMGPTSNRPFRIITQHQMPSLLCPGIPTKPDELFGRCFPLQLERSFPLHLSSGTSSNQGDCQNIQRESQLYPTRTLVAPPTLVSASVNHGKGQLCHSSMSPRPPHSQPRSTPPRHRSPPPHSLEDTRRPLSQAVMDIIHAAHRLSTRRSYESKWLKFSSFAHLHRADPLLAPTSVLLEYLASLAAAGLSLSSIRCYLAAITAYRRRHGHSSCFQDPVVQLFLQGFKNINPPHAPPPPAWHLDLVLSALMKPPFEPMATVDLSYVTWKTVFLVAVTSGRRASELCALRSDEPYIRFHPDKIVMRLDLSFLPKRASFFHISQDIILPAFFQTPTTPLERSLHLLDVRRALSFYLNRTKPFHSSPKLFLKYRKDTRGSPVSPQRLSGWVVATIRLAYQMAGKDPPMHIKGHSTRAVATSIAFNHGVPLEDICKAAIWSTPLTFVKHYKLDILSKRHAAFGRAVLFSAVA